MILGIDVFNLPNVMNVCRALPFLRTRATPETLLPRSHLEMLPAKKGLRQVAIPVSNILLFPPWHALTTAVPIITL